uniref:Ig-like domain-containing protein n=1 Tax=Erpetoichthys calabaricus TaxID=27687 RepID=A0A8C4TC09_ERPCA
CLQTLWSTCAVTETTSQVNEHRETTQRRVENHTLHSIITTIYFIYRSALCEDPSISLPRDIEALDGSCVFITCSFKGDHQCCTNQIGVWISDDAWKGKEVFRKGTSSDTWKNVRVTIGDVNVRNCSTQLDRVGPQQEGTYYFRTEGKLKNTFNKNAVSIKVTVTKGPPLITPVVPVVEGTATSLTCSAPSSCPSDPPVLTWSDTLNGAKTEESMWENGAKVSSVLRFTASHVHHNKMVTCTASSRGQHWTNTVTLNVTYSPKNTIITGLLIQNIPEGGAVTLSCTSNANPPSSYSWYHQRGSSMTRRASGQELTIRTVNLSDGGLYYCEAKNQHGGKNSTAMTLNVECRCKWKFLPCGCLFVLQILQETPP